MNLSERTRQGLFPTRDGLWCDSAYKDLPRRTAFDKLSRSNAIKITRNQNYNGNQRSLPSVVY